MICPACRSAGAVALAGLPRRIEARAAPAAERSRIVTTSRLTRQLDSTRLLSKAENGKQSFVDAPLLLRTDPAYEAAQAVRVHSADLLDEDAGGLAQHVDLRTERCGPCAVRRRRDEHY